MALMSVLWLAGGASRADALGQTLVRGAAWTALVAALLFADRPALRNVHPLPAFVSLALALAAVQLAPLPPGIWLSLPGREALAGAAVGQAQPWRPATMTPGATVNALSSLIVPVTTLLLLSSLRPGERSWLPGLVLSLVAASDFVGLLQFSGVRLDNPLVNDAVGQVSGTFANRNHFAVLLAIGCIVATAWGLPSPNGKLSWRAPIALGLIPLFLLSILASGSRAGLLTGALAMLGALMLSRGRLRRLFQRRSRWLVLATAAAAVLTIGVLVLVSIAADRAASIDRAFALDVGQDMRSRGLPVVLAMIRTYFPVGSGLGGFDPVFRMHEPLALLKLTYFNHAHDDYLEVALDAGLPGIVLMAAALLWWGWASARAWRAAEETSADARLGSGILAIVIAASAFDYPVRTPFMMAITMIAALWLAGSGAATRGLALPARAQHL